MGTYDVRSKNLGKLLPANHLDEALGLPRGYGPANTHPGEFADLDLQALFQSLFLREPH